MSALGQKQTCAAQKGMSALSPKADILTAKVGPPETSTYRQEFLCAVDKAEPCRWSLPVIVSQFGTSRLRAPN